MVDDRLPRKLAAIVYADVAGYSRLTGEDEDATHRTLRDHLDVIAATVESHRGQVVHYAGDAVLARFDAVVDALASAVAVQNALRSRNTGLPDGRRVEFRIGVNLGDVIEDRGDIYGDGVNVAARLESIGEPGGICISGSVHDAIGNKLPVDYVSMGEQRVKNIAQPVQAYKVLLDPADPLPRAAHEAPVALPDKPSIAVLPFSNMSGDPEQDYFSDGITEDITTALSKYRWFFVIARNTAFTFKDQAADIVEVGRQLGVRYVLEGSVRKAADRVRVTAQLIEATSGNHLWAERYDGDLADIFAVQDEITRAIVGELAPQFLSAEVQRSRGKSKATLDAWDLVMRGRAHLWSINREDNLEAERFFEAAIERAPDSGLGRSDLALTYLWQLIYGWTDDRRQTLRRMEVSAQDAMAADPNDDFALAVAAFIKPYEDHAADGVELARRAIAVNPNLALAHTAHGFSLVWVGDYAAAIDAVEVAMRLSPRDPFMGFILATAGITYYLLERYDETERIARRLIMEQPEMPTGYRQLAASLAQRGRVEEAGAVVTDHILRLIPGHSATESGRQLPFGRNERARRHWLDGLIKAGLPE